MDSPKLIIRIVAAGLPLVLIGIVFGAIGYATTNPATTPIPPLAAQEPGDTGLRGEVTGVSGDRITVVTDDGASHDIGIASGAVVESLEPISLADVSIGDWLNGGAIAHQQTILALVNLILLSEPVTP